ncbi:MAG: hypothetical protein ACXVPC_10970 [Tumebacillaceae bacterium]
MKKWMCLLMIGSVFSLVGCSNSIALPLEKQAVQPPVTSSAVAGDAQVKIISLKEQVTPNGLQTVVAQVPPHTKAHIEVDAGGAPFENQDLQDKLADANGQVSWTWKVANDPDDMVAVTVSEDGEEAYSMFQITP